VNSVGTSNELISIDTAEAGTLFSFNSVGTNSLVSNGGGGFVLRNVDGNVNISMPTTFTISSNGVLLTGISIFSGGSFDVPGTTTFDKLNGHDIFTSGPAGTGTFTTLTANNVGQDGLNLDVVTSNTGIFNINSRLFNNVGGYGIRMDSVGSGTGGGGTLNLFNGGADSAPSWTNFLAAIVIDSSF
tara:strand:+ start:157 stop:714 length:558 start_codon:yes stop_codon:yes gene_type:complete